MRLGIIACDILEREIEFLTKDDPDFTYREYIEFALHENPPEMKRVIIEKVNALEGRWMPSSSDTRYATPWRT